MTEPQNEGGAVQEQVWPVGTVRNMGEPLRFANVEPLAGFAAEATQGGQGAKLKELLVFAETSAE